MSDKPIRIGFVGLGNMGAPMAIRLAEAGFTVVAYDVSEIARQAIETASSGTVSTVSELHDAGKGVALLILVLPDSDVVESVLGDEALLGSLDADCLIVDMSSSEPWRTRVLAAALSARGLRMADAPISGGVAGARAGTLTVMVGASASDYEQLSLVLAGFGRVVHAGPIGAGHAVKALNNLLSATHLWITAEAMLAGERFGVDPEIMLSIFNSSSGKSGSTENKWPKFVLPGSFDSGFRLRLMLKDMRIATMLADEFGTPNELGSRAVELWNKAADQLPETADHTEIVKWLRARLSDED